MKKLILSTLLVILPLLASHESKTKSFVIVIPSYNNERWIQKNLESAINQKYKNFRIIYINDQSQDRTVQILDNILTECSKSKKTVQTISFDDSDAKDIESATEKFKNLVNQSNSFLTVVNNVNRAGALANLYRAIHSCKDNEIIVTLDGDDWLYNYNVLNQLNKVYNSRTVWLTHGRLITYPGNAATWCEPVPPHIVKNNAFRQFKCPSHLRTFYSWLFKKIKLEDLLYNGEFFAMTWDMAMMYPMIEMAGERHAFISALNYVYNILNPINDNKVNADLQNMLDRYIRQSEPYLRLEDAPLNSDPSAQEAI
ncbi:MAG: glycosyltransferase [Simkaniaceae bacterium]|nr:glycosyltransferase [Simkaniaceae bacterium]